MDNDERAQARATALVTAERNGHLMEDWYNMGLGDCWRSVCLRAGCDADMVEHTCGGRGAEMWGDALDDMCPVPIQAAPED